tara:strand:+ start:227 stop:439 length:213 start_codon:yes stop_codon:yes gene_type:complete
MNLNKSSKIYIAGHRGMVGSACWRILEKLGYSNLIGRTSKEAAGLMINEPKQLWKTEKNKGTFKLWNHKI